MNRATVRYTNKRRHLHHKVLVLLPVVLLLCVVSVLVVKTRGDRTSSHPLFYTDLTTGKEARINTAIVTAASLDYPYENTTNTFQSRFKRTLTDDAMVTVTQGEHVMSFGIPVTQSFGTLTQTDAVVTANTIVYPEVAPGANLRYTVTPEQLLEEYVMTSRDAATRVDALSQRMNLGANRAVVNLDGSVTISDQHQVPVFTLPKPVLYEDRFHKTRSYGIAYTVTQDNGSTILTKTLTPEGTAWLTDPHRRYPVVLDAAVTVATTTSGSGTAFSFQNKLFYDTVHNRYWAFYYDGSNVAYSYSTDGITWSSGGTLAYNTYDFSISYKEIAGAGTVYVAATCGSTGSVCVMKGIVGKTSISFSQGGEYTALTGTDATADAYNRVTIALDADNIIWVAARHQTKPANQLVFRYQASTVSSTQANNHSAWNTATPVGPAESLLTTLILLPKTGSTMALIAKDVGGTNIVSYQYNGTSWSSMNAGGDMGWFIKSDAGMDYNVKALALAGDGTLYAGGRFTYVNGMTVNRIAKWNGTSWSALGAGWSGYVNGSISALVVATDGSLYAGGDMSLADGVTVNNIAKWNGTSWSALGAGMDSGVNALVLAGDGTLYAGGQFTVAGGVTVNRIAKWNGTSWSALGAGMNTYVSALALAGDGTLYAGGSFTVAGGVTVNRIAKWNGTSWSALGAGMNSTVNALVLAGDGTLYAGGQFTVAGGVTVNYIAKWNGTSWSALGNVGMNSTVFALALAGDGTLYAGGGFPRADGVTVNRIAKWNGTSWSALGAGMNSNVYALALVGDGTLYAGGQFTVAGGVTTGFIAKWNGTSWNGFGMGIAALSIDALALAGDGTLYAGGGFTVADGVTGNNIAKWNGTSWSALGAGMNSTVYALALAGDGTLYAGGVFAVADGVTVNYIAKWNGTSWSALGAGMNSTVSALALAGDGTLYAGGAFLTAGGVTVNYIAKWNGTSWSALGAGMSFNVYELCIATDGTLYAGGGFSSAGGVVVNFIAKWNGTSWSAIGSGLGKDLSSLAVRSDGTLYADKYEWAPAISAGTSQIQEVSAVSDASGNIHVLYVDDNSDVQYKTYNGTSWGSKTALYASGPVATNPAITIDSDGYVYAFWRIGPSIYYAKSNTPGGSFSSPTTLYNTGTNTYVTASSGNNRILVSWINGVANPYTVLFDQTRTLTPTPHPTPPLSGNYTLSIDSGWSNLYDDGTLPTPSRKAGGVDAGTGITNSASLTVEHGVLNILDNETLVVGSLIMGVGGEVAIAEGATLKIGNALFVKDADSDGFAAESKVYYVATGTPTPAGGKRLNTISTLASVDCNDASYSVANSCCVATTLYQDQDGDGYGAGSPQTKCPEAGWVENNTDCKDTGTGAALVWVTASCYQDADNDNYGNTTAITCTDNATCTSATAGAVNAAGNATTGTFAANNTDCADNYSDVWYPITACYEDQDQDGYGASGGNMYTCMNNTTCASSTAGSVGTGTHSSYAAYSTTNTDCKDTGTGAALVWVTASCYQDADNDDYGSTTAITCTDNATCTSATAGAVNAAGDAATGTFASVNTDCCDSKNTAYPGSTTCSNVQTGCGNYDYNCDGTSTKCGSTRYTRSYYTLMECSGTKCVNTSTEIPCYNTAAPACGAAGYTKSATTTRKQSCKTCGGSNISCYTAVASTAQSCQ